MDVERNKGRQAGNREREARRWDRTLRDWDQLASEKSQLENNQTYKGGEERGTSRKCKSGLAQVENGYDK